MDSSYKIPGGGYVCTAEDLVRFESAMLDGKIVKPETVNLMWTSQKTADGKPTNYGMGFGITPGNGPKSIAHGGSQQGTSTSMMLVPEKRFAVAVMINMDGVPAANLARAILQIYVPQAK